MNIVMYSHGFKHGEQVLVKKNGGVEPAVLNYENELGAWVLIYTTEDGKPFRNSSGLKTIEFVYQVGWDYIKKA